MITIATVRQIRHRATYSAEYWDAAIERQPEVRTGEWAPGESVYLRPVAECSAEDLAEAAEECQDHWDEAIEALLDDDLARAIEHLTDARHLERWGITDTCAAIGMDVLDEARRG